MLVTSTVETAQLVLNVQVPQDSQLHVLMVSILLMELQHVQLVPLVTTVHHMLMKKLHVHLDFMQMEQVLPHAKDVQQAHNVKMLLQTQLPVQQHLDQPNTHTKHQLPALTVQLVMLALTLILHHPHAHMATTVQQVHYHVPYAQPGQNVLTSSQPQLHVLMATILWQGGRSVSNVQSDTNVSTRMQFQP